jgi:hypothetical protein
MWYMHDDASWLFSHVVRNVLSSTNRSRWIGRGGLTWSLPGSPDLNPLDLYVWRHLKSFVYSVPVHNTDILPQGAVKARQTASSYCDSPCWDVHKHVFSLMEDILNTSCKCVLSVLQCLRTHIYMNVFLFWYLELIQNLLAHFTFTLHRVR